MLKTVNVVPPPVVSTSQPKKRRLRWRYVALGLFVAFLLMAGLGFFSYQSLKEKVERGSRRLEAVAERLKTAPNVASLKWATSEIAAAENDFAAACSDSGWYAGLLPALEWLPGIGYDAAHLSNELEIAHKVTQAARLGLEVVSPALEKLDSSSGSNRLVILLDQLNAPASQSALREASQRLDEVATLRAQLDPSKLNLTQTRAALQQLDRQLPTLRQGLKVVQEWLPLLPDALGRTKPTKYLALIQNSDELRATGGFVSAVGLLTLDQAKINLSSFQDSYALDNPNVAVEAPPEALSQFMQAGTFLVRDANWWPDFPTSARKISQLYQQHQGQTVDAVLALDSKTVARLFEALGPLDLPAYNETLTAQNFEERLRFYYLPPGTNTGDEWWRKRKDFIGVTLAGLLGKLNTAQTSQLLKLVDILGQSASEKHLQVYFNSLPKLQTALTSYGIDGAQRQAWDYLMLVDSNVGFNKVNPNITRSASYEVASGGRGGSTFASLTLTYTNRAGVREGTQPGECVKVAKYDSSYQSMMNGCYWDYVRVYVPAGSILRDASGFTGQPPTALQENGKTVFATEIVVPPGQTLTLTLDYLLPNRLSSPDDYNLLVQKQAGTTPLPLSVTFTWAGQPRSRTYTLTTDTTIKLS